MRTVLIATALLAGLTACNMSGPRHPGEMFMSDSEILAKDDRVCRSYGAMPGSQSYAACRMQAQQIRYESSPDTRMSRMDISGFQPRRVQMNCTSSRFGTTVDTECY